ncbi:MAG: hypothetical protein DI598_18840, partial [Pseudopedobacter saltans]
VFEQNGNVIAVNGVKIGIDGKSIVVDCASNPQYGVIRYARQSTVGGGYIELNATTCRQKSRGNLHDSQNLQYIGHTMYNWAVAEYLTIN